MARAGEGLGLGHIAEWLRLVLTLTSTLTLTLALTLTLTQALAQALALALALALIPGSPMYWWVMSMVDLSIMRVHLGLGLGIWV